MNAYKNKLIDDFILPALKQITITPKLISKLYEMITLIQVSKHQLLELPGPHQQGKLWFSVSSMVHAYCFCPYKQTKWGTRIWKKREFILNSASLLNEEHRTDYLEVLEPGYMLYINYVNLLELIKEFPELEKLVQNIAACNEKYYRNHIQILSLPPAERVMHFEKENPLFVKVAGKDATAMHVGLTRQGYYIQLKKHPNNKAA